MLCKRLTGRKSGFLPSRMNFEVPTALIGIVAEHSVNTPLKYVPAHEKVEDDEAETNDELVRTLLKISHITYEDSDHAMRSVHAKSHGLLRGELQVLDRLPPELAQGLFAQVRHYPVIMRLSTSPGDILDDEISTPRGCALKIIGVEGPRLPGSEDDTTQDFLMVNGPAFLKPDAKSFGRSLKLLAGTTDKAPGLKKVLSAVLRGTEKAIEATGGQSATLKSLGGHPETNVLGETFYSQVPILYGPYMAKIALVPLSSSLRNLTDAPVDLKGKPDGLRGAVSEYFSTHSAEWELRLQLCTDIEKMPIEDASKQWPEELSPYLAVARIKVPTQPTWQGDQSVKLEDGLSFSPWHGLAAHRPLGSVNRARRIAYHSSAQFRTSKNGCPFHEPSSLP